MLLLYNSKLPLLLWYGIKEMKKSQCGKASNLISPSHLIIIGNIDIIYFSGRREDSSSINKDVDVLKDYVRSTEKQIDIQKPLIHLVDNMVKMSSMHGNGNRVGT